MVVGKKTKSIMVIFVWILAAIALGYALYQIFMPPEHEVDKTIYSSNISSNIDYTVRLNYTPVYGSARDAEPSKYYLLPFTDYMSLNCRYNFSGTAEKDILTNSYVTAFLVSYIDEGAEEVVLWKKEYELSALETTEIASAETSGEKTIEVKFDEYDKLIEKIESDYYFRSEYYLLVVYTTEFQVDVDGQIQKKILQPSIRINLEDVLFEIDNVKNASDSIHVIQKQTVVGEINFDRVVISGTMFVLLSLLAILLPTRIISSVPLTEEAKAIRKINIKYGDRIVQILDKPVISDSTVRLESIDDIMKIAEEIAQPIFNVSIDDETYYYVNNNGVIYYISLKTK